MNNDQGPAISLEGSVSLSSWAVRFCQRGILPGKYRFHCQHPGTEWEEETGEYQVSAIRLELNTTGFRDVPHLPHIATSIFSSPEPLCSLQEVNVTSSSGLGEGKVPACTGFNYI